MAKQTSILKVSGTLGGVTFYQSGGLDLARMKSSLSRETVLDSPNFVRTRENANEFKRGANFMKAVRKSFWGVFVGNDNYVGRMNAYIYRLLESDNFHSRGERLCSYSGVFVQLLGFGFLQGPNLDFLSGFVFYDLANHALSGTYSWEVVGLDCGAVVFPPGATHFQILGAFGQVHKDSFEVVVYPAFAGPYLSAVSGVYSQGFSLGSVLPIDSMPYRSFMCIRVQFFQFVGGTYAPLRAGLGCGLVWTK